MNTVFWLCAMVVFLIIEAITPMLISIWFALGALIAGACAYFGVNETMCILIFAIVSAVSLWVFKKLYKKNLAPKHQPTNADRLIGKEGIVQEDIDPVRGKGSVDVQGRLWSAKSDKYISSGTLVEVSDIEGVKLLVKER